VLLEEMRGTLHVAREDILCAKIHGGMDVQHSRSKHSLDTFSLELQQ